MTVYVLWEDYDSVEGIYASVQAAMDEHPGTWVSYPPSDTMRQYYIHRERNLHLYSYEVKGLTAPQTKA